jgi:signal transduction histidine kinase
MTCWNLARVTRAEIHRETIDLTKMVTDIARDMQSAEPNRGIRLRIDDGLTANGDHRLVRVALQNLLGNAWKFTSKRSRRVNRIQRAGFQRKPRLLCPR